MPRANMYEIVFQFETEYGVYRDALYFPDTEPLPPEAEIEAMKLERLNNWLAIVTPQPPDPNIPPLPPPPPPEV